MRNFASEGKGGGVGWRRYSCGPLTRTDNNDEVRCPLCREWMAQKVARGSERRGRDCREGGREGRSRWRKEGKGQLSLGREALGYTFEYINVCNFEFVLEWASAILRPVGIDRAGDRRHSLRRAAKRESLALGPTTASELDCAPSCTANCSY